MIRLLMIATLYSLAMPAIACSLDDATRVKLADGVTMFYRVKAPPLVLAQHFSMRFRFCRSGQTLVVNRFRLDAIMPAHKHAMNYRVKVIPQQNGSIETTGLLFHMPGHWQVIIDFEYDDTARQLKLDYQI